MQCKRNGDTLASTYITKTSGKYITGLISLQLYVCINWLQLIVTKKKLAPVHEKLIKTGERVTVRFFKCTPCIPGGGRGTKNYSQFLFQFSSARGRGGLFHGPCHLH